MVRSLLLLSLLLAVASRAVAQGWGQNREPASLEVAAALKRADAFFRDNNIKLWPEVLRIAGVEKEMRAPPARYAALIPTDAAVSSFLKDMGVSMNSLAARPLLAKQLVAQHLVLALPPDTQQALVEGRITSVPTLATDRSGGASHTILQAAVKGGSSGSSGSSGSGGQQQQQRQLHITDGQGRTAVAVQVVRQDANKVAIIIDRVLLSGHYYPNFATLCKLRAAQAGPMCAALTQSGVLKEPQQPTFADTVFMSGPKAFQAAGIQLSGTGSSSSSSSSLSQQQLTELVKYHVVPGLHAFPDGFKDGGSYSSLLPGASLGIAFSGSLDQAANSQNATLVAYVIPTDKQRIPVAVYNIFVGQGIVQGIPAVLLPPGFKAPAASPGTTAAEKGQAAGGATSQGRQLLGSGIDTIPNIVVPFNAAETQIRAQTRSMFKDQDDRWS